jgi:hypothetical protein
MEDSGRPIRLQLASRVLTLAKDPDWPEENQDYCRVEGARGVAVAADGVTSAIFSRLWARILVEAAVDGLPDPDDREPFARWLSARREEWSRQIDVSRLAWFQKPKLREGAFSTLLYVRLIPPEEAEEGNRAWRLSALAVGDTCLFYVREGSILRKFPVQSAAELERNPVVLGSIDLHRDDQIKFCRMEEPCQPGDLVVLCTDALAEWALRLEESGRQPQWQTYWDIPQAAWEEEIKTLRTEREIRCDDTTLVLLRVADEDSIASRPAVLPAAEPAAQAAAAPCETSEVSKTTIEQVSDLVGRQLSEGAAWAKKRLKQAGQTASSALKKYLDKIRPDDRR